MLVVVELVGMLWGLFHTLCGWGKLEWLPWDPVTLRNLGFGQELPGDRQPDSCCKDSLYKRTWLDQLRISSWICHTGTGSGLALQRGHLGCVLFRGLSSSHLTCLVWVEKVDMLRAGLGFPFELKDCRDTLFERSLNTAWLAPLAFVVTKLIKSSTVISLCWLSVILSATSHHFCLSPNGNWLTMALRVSGFSILLR